MKLGGGVETLRVHHRTVGATEPNIHFARQLRRKMSLPEVLLWRELRQQPGGFRFRRQFPIEGYVLDFACLSRRLAVEIDGDLHGLGNRPAKDQQRDAVLATAGFKTLRIPARDVLGNLEAVLSLVFQWCEDRPLHHSTLSSGPPPRSGEDL